MIDKDWITLAGLTDNPRDTVLADNRGHMIGASSTGGSSPAESLLVTGTGFSARNLTIGNYCNVDLVYPRNPTLNQKKRSDTITQAYAIGAHNSGKILDKFTFANVHFIGMLDTLALAEVKRAYFNNVYVQGTDDFIGGGNVHVFANSRIKSFSSKPLFSAGKTTTAFINTDWEVALQEPGDLYLAKSASAIILNQVRFHDSKGTLNSIHWTPRPKSGVQNYAYGVTLNQANYTLHPTSASYQLSKSQAKLYSARQLLAGSDGWNPTDNTVPLNKSVPLIVQLKAQTATASATVQLDAEVYPPSAAETLKWYSPDLTLTPVAPQQIQINNTADIETPISKSVRVTGNGSISNNIAVTIVPSELPAPKLTQRPTIAIANGKAKLDYALALHYRHGQRPDRSRIQWYRMQNPDDANPIALAINQRGDPLQHYTLQTGDAGHYLAARIQPQHNRSTTGEPTWVVSDRAIDPQDIEIDTDRVTLTPEFFPLARQPRLQNNAWLRDAHYPKDQTVKWRASSETPWHYGRGINGAADSVGLIPRVQGARLLYHRPQPSTDMQLSVHLDTEKTAAQGFGSPNGQYLEVYIDYDAASQSGYALRIERTDKYANATDFTLYRYRRGVGQAISKSVSATAFNPGTRIVLRRTKTQLSAQVSSAKGQTEQQKRAGLATEVQLQAEVGGALSGGFGLQHTGTVSPGGRFVLTAMQMRYSR
ncbi:hypothetical protein [Gilvimarinus sp. DA14]|uniref:hypothetical protein n=1 Tax=Gilvimarinus sp. DA14 TaxID=2956798 RepID=UPI0020B6A95F|nr:hypothetical protein [Gilvimarinus sp. DA14]UTF59474.1 hypothetical protein NHM04_13485 [Gilvimarinus sp. DA14]